MIPETGNEEALKEALWARLKHCDSYWRAVCGIYGIALTVWRVSELMSESRLEPAVEDWERWAMNWARWKHLRNT